MQSDTRRLVQRFMRLWRFRGRDRRYRALPSVAPPATRLPATHGLAAGGLVDRVALNSATYNKLVARSDLEKIHPDLRRFYLRFQSELQKRGIPLYVHSAYRSDAEQAALFKRGVTKARAGQSGHNHGMAFDFVHWSRHWDLTRLEWAVIGAIGKESARKMNLKVTWGGDWKRFYDPAHWELFNWGDIVRNGG